MSVIIADPGDNCVYEMDWSELLEDGVTLSSVAHTVPSPLTLLSESCDGTSSLVRLSGSRHAGVYMIEGTAVLSTGETLNSQFTLRGFNG